jgi:hypothetical protein
MSSCANGAIRVVYKNHAKIVVRKTVPREILKNWHVYRMETSVRPGLHATHFKHQIHVQPIAIGLITTANRKMSSILSTILRISHVVVTMKGSVLIPIVNGTAIVVGQLHAKLAT